MRDRSFHPIPRLAAVALAALTVAPAVAGNFTWNSGAFVPGVTAPHPLPVGDVLSINGGAGKIFSAVTFDVLGTVDWYADTLLFQSGSVVHNAGLWQAASDDSFASGGGAQSTFINSGVFSKTAGTGTTRITGVKFVNSGMLEAQIGTIEVSGGDATFNVGTQFTGAGQVRIASNARFTGSYFSTNLWLSAGIFTGGDGSPGSFVVAGGDTTFEGGVMTGGWQLTGDQTLRAVSGGTKTLSAMSLDNQGEVVWDTTDALRLQSGTVFDNQGKLSVTQGTTLTNAGGALSTFDNRGQIDIASGKTLSVSSIRFVNHVGGTVANDGVLDFDGGNAELMAGTTVTGAGTVRFNSNITAHGDLNIADLQMRGGTLTANAVAHHGTLTWEAGVVTGAWQVPEFETLRAVSGGLKTLAVLNLDNQGEVVWDTTDALRLQTSAVFDNQGKLSVTQGTTLTNAGGALSTFDNRGQIDIASGKTLSVSSIRFVNHVDGTVANDGVLDFDGGNAELMAGTTVTGAGTVRFNSNITAHGDLNIADLQMRAGTLTADAVAHHGTLTWEAGVMTGAWQVPEFETLRAVSGGLKTLAVLNLDNQGEVVWDTTDALRLQTSAVFDNQGKLSVTQGTTLTNAGGALSTFDNRGQIDIASGKTLSVSSIRFVNHVGGTVANDGVLDFDGGNAELMAGTTVTGAGTVRFNSNITAHGDLNIADLQMRAGTLTADAVAHHGTLTWESGVMTGAWQVPEFETLRAVSGGLKTLAVLNLDNQGEVVWDTTDALRLQSGTVFDNQGKLSVTQGTTLTNAGGALSTFDNRGQIDIASGKTLSVSSIRFVNHVGGTVANDGVLDFDGGNAELMAGTTVTGAGTVRFNSNITAHGDLNIADLQMRAGTLTADAVAHHGTLTWESGVMTGAWQVRDGSHLNVVDGANKTLSVAQLTVVGQMSMQTSQGLQFQSATQFANQGVVDVQADGAWVNAGGASSSVVNEGLIKKSGGAGDFVIGNGLGFDNQGTVDVQVGTVVLPTNFSNAGTLMGVGTFALIGTLSNVGHVAPGASPGQLTIDGHFAQPVAGVLDIDIGSLLNSDLLLVSGDVDLGGTLALHCHVLCKLALGDELLIVDAGGSLSASTFDSVAMSGFATGAFDVIYDIAQSEVRLLVTQAVTPAVPEPDAWALWLAGLVGVGWLVRRRQGRSRPD